MGQTICFANNKGGVGKTTTSVAIGQAWARMNKKVLFIDLDSQANLTRMVSPIEPKDRKYTVADALLAKGPLQLERINENIDLLPAGLALSNFDKATASLTGREYLLVDALAPVKDRYDFIIIDCPPALGLITYNAMIASDHLVMVATPDYLAYEGMLMVGQVYEDVSTSARLNQNLSFTGVIVTKYKNNNLSKMFADQVENELGPIVLKPFIGEATKITQAGSFRQSIYDYDPKGKVTLQYIEVAKALALRILTEK